MAAVEDDSPRARVWRGGLCGKVCFDVGKVCMDVEKVCMDGECVAFAVKSVHGWWVCTDFGDAPSAVGVCRVRFLFFPLSLLLLSFTVSCQFCNVQLSNRSGS
jgi:hypothetical protein